jgi:hypothetical protein
VCQTRDLWNIPVSAAARCMYIETVCNDLSTAPDGNTVRVYLNEQPTPKIIRVLRRDCNHSLASQLPVWLRAHPK